MNVFFRSTLIHPFLFAFFPIVFLFSINVGIIEQNEILVPLIVIGIIIMILLIIMRKFFKKEKVSILISIGVTIFFSYGHVFNILETSYRISEFNLLLLLIGLFFIGVFYLIITKRKLDNANVILNVIGITLIIVSMSTIVTNNLETYDLNLTNQDFTNESFLIAEDVENKPNIYYIILDAYAGSESLEEFFDFDNSEFLSFLEKEGFIVIKNSHSNYPSSEQSLASSLNINYIHNIFPNMQGDFKLGIVGNRIDNNVVMQNLKLLGYNIINFNSGIGFTRNLQIADETICERYGEGFLNFEMLRLLTKNSLIFPIQTKLYQNDMRDQILCIFEELPEIHKEKEEPFFVFAHIFIPHRPFIFDANGEVTNTENLEIAKINQDKNGYINQLIFTNKMVKQTITQIISTSDNQPIIIIQGDHGATVIPGLEEFKEDAIRERFSNLNAYYLPSNPKIKLHDGITPVNTFRLIFNNYFNSTYNLLEDKSYVIISDTSESVEIGKYLVGQK